MKVEWNSFCGIFQQIDIRKCLHTKYKPILIWHILLAPFGHFSYLAIITPMAVPQTKMIHQYLHYKKILLFDYSDLFLLTSWPFMALSYHIRVRIGLFRPLLCTSLEARRAEALPIDNVRGALVFLREFLVWILILHILKVTKGSNSSLELLQVTTGYYRLLRLLQVTTGYYRLLQVT